MTNSLPAEQFSALNALPGVVHAFTTRVAGIDVSADKAEALRRLDRIHRDVRRELGVAEAPFVTAEQVHGKGVAVIDRPIAADTCFNACDGLITNQRGLCLGIYVADCCAVYLVDPIQQAIGLVHSGKKGTELAITTNVIDLMEERFGSRASDLIIQLSPCIRPPHYEIDFAAEIVRSARERGVVNVHDPGVCTACDLERYYSYRAEKAKTGRMLAMFALA